MRDGEGSIADIAWREHAATCPECQASLHILHLLQEDAHAEEYRLPEQQVRHLMDMVDQRFSVKQHHRGLGILWKTATVASVVFIVGHCFSLPGLLERSVGPLTHAVLQATAHPASTPAAPVAAPAEEPVDLNEFNLMEESIEEVRSRIDYQYSELHDLIDHDFNGY